jgi:uncharacterized membrane protein
MLPWHQYILGFLFLLAGANHFRTPKLYERIIPSYMPDPKTLVILSGIAEMCFGLLLLNPENQTIGAWGIIILLIIFIPIHIFMLQDERASLKLPKWLLVLRLPLQLLLMYWAFLYT